MKTTELLLKNELLKKKEENNVTLGRTAELRTVSFLELP